MVCLSQAVKRSSKWPAGVRWDSGQQQPMVENISIKEAEEVLSKALNMKAQSISCSKGKGLCHIF